MYSIHQVLSGEVSKPGGLNKFDQIEIIYTSWLNEIDTTKLIQTSLSNDVDKIELIRWSW